jgi:hypothetical protein
LLVAGSAVALAVGTLLTVTQRSALWLVVAVASVIANVGVVLLGRRRLRGSGVGPPTG